MALALVLGRRGLGRTWPNPAVGALVVKDASNPEAVSEGDIKAHLKVFADGGVISKYGIPEKILFVDSLPRTSVGKVNKKELRQKYGDV